MGSVIPFLPAVHAHVAVTAAPVINRDEDARLPALKGSDVLIIGTGKAMIEQVLSLVRAGYQGRIIAVSRRALMPCAGDKSRPLSLDRADLPLGAGASYSLRWLKTQVDWHCARGGNWRDMVDGVERHMEIWWNSNSSEVRNRFLRHAFRYWHIHTGRIPSARSRQIETMRNTGKLQIVAGELIHVLQTEAGLSVTVRDFRSQQVTQLSVATIYQRSASRTIGNAT